MGYRLLRVLMVISVAETAAHAQGLEDFANISRAIGKDVAVVDRTGQIREGVVEAVTVDGVTLRVGSASHWLSRAEIASAERLKDDSSDGAIKGALWALALGLIPNQGYSSVGEWQKAFWTSVTVFTVAGYLLDAAESNRQPLYRGPAAPAPTLKLSLRF